MLIGFVPRAAEEQSLKLLGVSCKYLPSKLAAAHRMQGELRDSGSKDRIASRRVRSGNEQHGKGVITAQLRHGHGEHNLPP